MSKIQLKRKQIQKKMGFKAFYAKHKNKYEYLKIKKNHMYGTKKPKEQFQDYQVKLNLLPKEKSFRLSDFIEKDD